jgi:cell division protein FtsW (lipid II flippase)
MDAAVPPAPARRHGRHVRRTIRPAVAAVAAALALDVLLVALAPPEAASAGVTVTVLVITLCLCRLIAAQDADAGEERWLRHVLGRLQPAVGDEDEDEDLLVY